MGNTNSVINGYLIDSELGSGSFGTTYKATKNGQCYAIKMIIGGSDDNKIKKEVQIFSSLSHQNVVKYLDNFLYDNTMCIVMEYCDGGTLNSHILGFGPLPIDQLTMLNFILQISTGVEYLHSQNVIHRDIKPDNIMLSIGLKGFILKISDFGLARVFENFNQELQYYYGFQYIPKCPRFYSAPELLNNHMTFSSDIFSFGCVILGMFSRTPVPGVGGKPIIAPYIKIQNNPTPLALVDDNTKWNYIQHVVQLPFGINVQADLQNLVFKMVKHDCQQRPTANDICTELTRIRNILLPPLPPPVQLVPLPGVFSGVC